LENNPIQSKSRYGTPSLRSSLGRACPRRKTAIGNWVRFAKPEVAGVAT